MGSKAVSVFNNVCGNVPSENLTQILKQIENQCTFLIEEVLEMKEAAKSGDWTSVLDAHADIRFVRDYLDDLCLAAGLKINKAFDLVCENNSEKFSTSKELVEKWQQTKDPSKLETYIAETDYDGTIYYTLRRKSDGKVQKYLNFPHVDLSSCVPKELLNGEGNV